MNIRMSISSMIFELIITNYVNWCKLPKQTSVGLFYFKYKGDFTNLNFKLCTTDGTVLFYRNKLFNHERLNISTLADSCFINHTKSNVYVYI